MTISRETHKKKIYGKDNDGNDTGDWIEVERTDKLIVETGEGIFYQQTIFEFVWPDDEEDDGSRVRHKIQVTDPNADTDGASSDGVIELYVIDQLTVENGQGQFYQKTTHVFDNTEENEGRHVQVKTVHGTDGVSTVDVEEILQWTTENGEGTAYQQSFWEPEWPMNEDDQSGGA